MLLSNLTASASTCNTLINMNVSILPDPKSSTLYFPVQSRSGTCPAPVPYPSGEPREVLALPLLVDAFVQGAAGAEIEDKDKRPRKSELHFLSSVFANLSTVSSPSRIDRIEMLINCSEPDTFWACLLSYTTSQKTFTVKWRSWVSPVQTSCIHRTQRHYQERWCYFDNKVRLVNMKLDVPLMQI